MMDNLAFACQHCENSTMFFGLTLNGLNVLTDHNRFAKDFRTFLRGTVHVARNKHEKYKQA